MKIQKLFLPILILTMFFSGSIVQAQSKSEKEKEQKIRELEKKLEQALEMQEIELQKVLEESKKIDEEDLKKVLENHKKIQQKAKEQYQKAWELNKDKFYDQWEDEGSHSWKDYNKAMKDYQYRIVTPPDLDIYFDGDDKAFKGLSGTFITSARDRTALTIQKDLEDVTFDTKFKYEVTEGANGLNFKVSGSMDEGTLLVKLVKPDGDVLQEIEVSPLADIDWNQDLRWNKEEDKEKNLGSWVIVVSAENATGHYHVNVRAN